MHTIRTELMKKVSYIRVDEKEQLVRGEGVIVGEFVTPAQRANVHIKDGDKIFSLEPYCINPTPEEEQAYLAQVLKVRATAKEYNDKSSHAIADGNAAIDVINDEFFGPRLA